MKKLFIGIDPDVDKSGFCILNDKMQIEKLTTLDLVDLFSELTALQNNCANSIIVFVEAGWNNKTNFHVKGIDNALKSAKIGGYVGANHEIGKQIIKFCKKTGIDVKEITPKSHKMDSADFKERTGYKGRTNQEMRDAYRIILLGMQ